MRKNSRASHEPPGCNIRRLRMALEYSQRQLAQRCDPELDHTTIRRLELNQGYQQETLERVAKALGTTVQNLFLPEELAEWPTLQPRTRQRIADSIRDAVVAQHYKSTG